MVLDTCALLWWTLEPDGLSPEAAALCADMPKSGAIISSISLWEVGIKVKRGKLDIGMEWRRYFDLVTAITDLTIVPVTERVWRENLELEWEHSDPANRTIVATARLYDDILLTADGEMRAFYPKCRW
ncbi:MAG: type II toxin-antitoxin system VapC family toxin [Rectinemataceae bacterium]